MRRIALKVEYDGTRFLGWQLQAEGRTVQGVLEEAVRRAMGSAARVPLRGASRTDAGVHALGQVAHFDTASSLSPEVIVRAVNYWLPRDVSVLAACEAPDGFDARFSPVSKLYRYRVLLSRVRRPTVERYCLRQPGGLDLRAMRECARVIVGAHDFASFTTERHEGQNTVRAVLRSEWVAACGELHYWVEADGFLYNMVRALVGTMLEAGRGKLSAGEFASVLERQDRCAAGPTAPPHGLALVEVRYGKSAPGSWN